MIDDSKVEAMYNDPDKALEKISQEYKPNYFELVIILYMMDTKLKQSKIEQYLVETAEKFTKYLESQKKEDDELK